MFQELSSNISSILSKVRTKGSITESDLTSCLREIKVALLQADVAVSIAKSFIKQIKEDVLGKNIIKSLSPDEVIKSSVHNKLVELLGKSAIKPCENLATHNKKSPYIVLVAGLQGSGKTTSSAKLAHYISKQHAKAKILLTSLDIYRPAAQEQLATLADRLDDNVTSLEIIKGQKPLQITERAINFAKNNAVDVIILDTAGRQYIDEKLMQELRDVEKLTKPQSCILVADAMMGQEATNTAKAFNDAISLDSIILSRLDSDAKAGVALSVREITGIPIVLSGTGENVDGYDLFHPERVADRILGLGDIASLVEKTQENISEDEALGLIKKLEKGNFNLNDLLNQMRKIKKMGSLGKLMGMLPGMSGIMSGENLDEDQAKKSLAWQEAIICSMTMHERRFPKALNASRKRRISRGAGVHVSEINRLLKRFAEMQKMMKQFKKSNKKSSALNAIDGISTKISSKQQLQAMGNNLKNQDLSKIFKL